MKEENKVIHCGKCHKPGHNKTTCGKNNITFTPVRGKSLPAINVKDKSSVITAWSIFKKKKPALDTERFVYGFSIQPHGYFHYFGFKNANLSKLDMNSSIFIQSDFSYTNCKNASFHNCSFELCEVTGADFTNADFSDVDFSGSLENAKSLRRANFDNSSNLEGNYSRKDLTGASFHQADLRRVVLDDTTNMTGCNVEKAKLPKGFNKNRIGDDNICLW